ncbi:lectin-like domain-containing protein [Tunturiibacter gelidiferens]|uniref:lectin-like domain-containing protein n=1 Tax=Tunturiibacter gelidiferens TaxID=3069689 RepID=UPI003D9B42B7
MIGNALPPNSACAIQLSAAVLGQRGEIVWPNLISTGDIQLSFTITTSNSSNPPADGFAMVLGDPSLGATTTSIGATGGGLGAEGIPGIVLAFDDYHDPGDPPVPYLGVGRGRPLCGKNHTSTSTPTFPRLPLQEPRYRMITSFLSCRE